MSAPATPSDPWCVSVLTSMPVFFPGALAHGLAGAALSEYKWKLDCINLRDFATDRRGSVDDTPAGGGAGMILRADILMSALDSRIADHDPRPRLYLSPRGSPLTQKQVCNLADAPGAILLCGRYEGVDQRFLDHGRFTEVSIGDFILSGGEIAALALIDAVVRLLPGVLGNPNSRHQESFNDNLLEHPHYTRPRTVAGRSIPAVLLSGNHAAIAAWRRQQAETLTQRRRPDLWARHRSASASPTPSPTRDRPEPNP